MNSIVFDTLDIASETVQRLRIESAIAVAQNRDIQGDGLTRIQDAIDGMRSVCDELNAAAVGDPVARRAAVAVLQHGQP
ncbi:MAG: hypothetical protein LLG14_09330 [Nocardiaceae bacterium]|nr:hypothetical protein [Nocardiaceae bacterium]